MINLDQGELGKILELLGLSLKDLEDKTGTDKSTWSALFNGSRWFQWPTIVAASKKLGIEPNHFVIFVALKRLAMNAKKKTEVVDSDS
jgi:hypothetical protein